MRLFLRLALLGLTLSIGSAPVVAGQLPPSAGGPQTLRPVSAEASLHELDRLFADLAAARTAGAAALVENRIRVLWMKAAGPTAGVLIDWADKAAGEGDYAKALDCLDEAQSRAPTAVEVYYRRAGIHYLSGDLSLAFGDIETALRVEPRHFPAMRALSEMLTDIGDARRALEVLRRLQALDPHCEGLDEAIEAIVAGSHGRDT